MHTTNLAMKVCWVQNRMKLSHLNSVAKIMGQFNRKSACVNNNCSNDPAPYGRGHHNGVSCMQIRAHARRCGHLTRPLTYLKQQNLSQMKNTIHSDPQHPSHYCVLVLSVSHYKHTDNTQLNNFSFKGIHHAQDVPVT